MYVIQVFIRNKSSYTVSYARKIRPLEVLPCSCMYVCKWHLVNTNVIDYRGCLMLILVLESGIVVS